MIAAYVKRRAETPFIAWNG